MPESANPRTYGHIPGVPVGAVFKNREALMKAGVHGQSQAGIHGDSSPGGGAFSICISEGYEDNEDRGNTIIYVGSGGQNSRGEQVAHQSFEDSRNRALQMSCETRLPVRVIRGKNKSSFYAPASGYRYDGLYVVESAELRRGKKDYDMCFFRLQRMEEEGVGPLPTRRLLTLKKLGNIARRAQRK